MVGAAVFPASQRHAAALAEWSIHKRKWFLKNKEGEERIKTRMTADLKNFVFPEQALMCPHALERGILRAKRHPWELSSRHKSPPMLLASSRDKASPSPTPGCFPAASSADLEKGRNSFPFRESEMPSLHPPHG